MPNVVSPSFQVEDLSSVLQSLRQFAQSAAPAINSSLVIGDSLLTWAPYTSAAPLVVPGSWSNLTLFNSWVAFGGAEATPQYRIDPITGEVVTKGLIKSGTATAGTQVASVPSTLAPSENQSFAVRSGSGGVDVAGSVVVNTAGGLFIFLGGNSYLSLTARWLPATPSPYVPSCFPFDNPWPYTRSPKVVVAQAQDVSNQASPSNLALCLPDWAMVTLGSRQLLRIRNIPGLLPSKSYAVQVWAF